MWIMISSSLDIDFIHGDIHGRSCKKMSNFNYFPIAWMLTSNKSLDKIKNIQKRALRFVLNDYETSYHDLLIQSEVSGIKIMTLRLLAIEVFKCVIKLNSEYLNEMLTIKIVHTTFVIVLFWKGPIRISSTKYKVVSLGDFKNIIKSWNGPSCKCPVCSTFLN